MKNATALFMVPFLALALFGCGSGGGGGGGGGAVTCSGTTITAAEANNYAFSSTLTFPPIMVQPKSNLAFDWGSVTVDFLGHPVDAKRDLLTISVLEWDLALSDLEAKLNADNLPQSDLTVIPLTLSTDGSNTFANLFDFTNNGAPVASTTIVPYFDDANYPPSNHTYTVMAATATPQQVGQGTRMIQSFLLDPNSTNTNVKMTNDSTKLTYTADLHSLKATGVPAGQAAITLDWTAMDKKLNALGHTFDATSITSAMIGHYTQTPAELEKKFLDLELIATELYRGNIDIGTTVDFSTMTMFVPSGAGSDAGTTKPFPGIDNTGTWLVALQCGGCRNPAPWYLTILKPCS